MTTLRRLLTNFKDKDKPEGREGAVYRGGSRIFFGRGCSRLLLYFNTNKPHRFFFCRIPVVLENGRSSHGGGGVRTPCTPPLDPPLVLYKIKCCDCQANFIGETCRNLSSRLTDHKRATRKGDVNNHIAEQHLQKKHQIDWDSATYITYSTYYY